MNSILHDVRYALRGFVTSPLFTAVAILSLAFGIGANTAIFTLLDQVMLRLLPVKNPQQLMLFTMRGRHYGSNTGGNAISYPMYRDFRDHNQVFSGMFCRYPLNASLGYGNHTERIDAALVSGNYFPVLGVGAALGRTFTADDDRVRGGEPLVVLSYDYWKTRFTSDPSILGKKLVINGNNMTVVGVAQRGFTGVQPGFKPAIFVPIAMKKIMTPNWYEMDNRRMRWVNAFGRLKPGITRQQAKASLQPFMHSMLEMEVREPAFRNASRYDRDEFLKCWMDLLPGSQGRSSLRESLSTPLLVLFGITGVVLLMACANLANLMVARASTRRKEMAIRLAIGAGRTRIIRQLLIESGLLSLFGACAGLALAWVADQLLLKAYLSTEAHDSVFSTAPDGRVLAFTLVVTALTTILFGLVPALQASKSDVAPTLKDQAGAVVSGGHVLLRKSLVAMQVGLSLLLLIAAGLFMRTLTNLRDTGPGFDADQLIGFDMDPSLNGYTPERTKIFYRQLADDLRTIPGVRAVALARMRILEDNEWDDSMTVEGYNAAGSQRAEPYMNWISPGYFAALKVPLLSGRDFTLNDTHSIFHGPDPDSFTPDVAIVNETFVNKYFNGRDPLGLHIGLGNDPGTKTDIQVVGVVKDIKYTNLRDQIPPQCFLPYLADRDIGFMTVYVRTTIDTQQLAAAVRAKVRQLDPNLPLYHLRSTNQQIDISLRTERLVASLSTVFGLLATLLAVIGLYGVMAYTVARRTREIGIRMALGAVQGSVIWLVMAEVLLLIAIGIAAGLPTALALGQLAKSQLYGLAPHDVLTISLATLTLIGVAGLAGFIPALRASRIDPIRALRHE
ncbi:MAG: ABC transporter permease [Bryobacteraceae bacterium]